MSSRSIGVMKLSTSAWLILSEATRSRWRASLKASRPGVRSGALSISYSALVLSWAATAASSSKRIELLALAEDRLQGKHGARPS